MRRSPILLCLLAITGCTATTSGTGPNASPSQQLLAQVIPTGAGKERCGLPPQATVLSATVAVRVMVMPDGTPQHVEVTKTSAPNQGLEAAARTCAMNYKYSAAQDANGKPLRNWTREFDITFVALPEYPNQKSLLLR